MSKIKEMITTLFPVTKNVDEVVGIIEKHRMKFGQIIQEILLKQ